MHAFACTKFSENTKNAKLLNLVIDTRYIMDWKCNTFYGYWLDTVM